MQANQHVPDPLPEISLLRRLAIVLANPYALPSCVTAVSI